MGHYRLEPASHELSFRWKGLPHLFGGRVALTLVLVCFGGSFVTLFARDYAEILPAGWYLEWAWLWRMAIVVGIFGGFAALIIGGLVFQASSWFSYWRSFAFDATDHSFELSKKGWLGFRSGSSRFSSRDFDFVFARVGADDGEGVPIELAFEVPSDPDEDSEWLELDFTVEDVDSREEALDLVFRIARALGRPHYQVVESGARFLALSLQPEASEGSRPVQPRSGPTDYEQDLLRGTVALPEREVATYAHDPESGVGCQIARWDPGTLVHFLRRPPTLRAVAVLGLVAGLALGGILSFADDAPGGIVERFAWCIAIATAGVWVAMHRTLPGRDVTIDWMRRRITWRGGLVSRTPDLLGKLTRLRRSQEEPIGRVDEVLIRGRSRQQSSGTKNQRRTWTEYNAQLVLRVAGRHLTLLDGSDWTRDSDEPAAELTPLAAALAGALHAPWRWVEYRPGAVAGRLAPILGNLPWLILSGVMIGLAFLVFTYVSFEDERADAMEAMRGLGAEVESVVLYVGDDNLFGEGWVIEMVDKRFDDEGMRELHAILTSTSWLATLDLSGTRVTDAGAALLGEVDYLFAVELADTPLTDAGLAGVAAANVQYLDLRRTQVTDAGLATFVGRCGLRYLLLEGHFTDAVLESIADCVNLEYLAIVSPHVTDEALEELRWGVRSDLVVDRTGANAPRFRTEEPTSG